jgi:RNA polymerase sigma-70 factor (ECF subfamily)
MVQQEDCALLSAVAHRDQDAFERLYERYHTLVYHLAYKVLQNRERAEEVVYEVFWQVWREAERYDVRRGSVGAWVATLARSRAIDALRAQRGSLTTGDDVALLPVATGQGDDPETVASFEQRALLVRAALQSLSPEQRTALELSFFGGLSHAEIADRLAEPLGTVKTRIRSALLRLRERLRPLLGGDQ